MREIGWLSTFVIGRQSGHMPTMGAHGDRSQTTRWTIVPLLSIGRHIGRKQHTVLGNVFARAVPHEYHIAIGTARLRIGSERSVRWQQTFRGGYQQS